MGLETITNQYIGEDKSQIVSLLDKAYALRTNNIRQSIELAQSALSLSKRAADTALIARSLSQLSLFYMIQGDNESTLRTGEEAIKYLLELKDEKGIADAKYNMAGVYYKTDCYHLALVNLVDCVTIYRKVNDQHGLARSQKWLGTVYEYFSDNKNAIISYEAAINSAQLIGDINLESNAYNPLSGIYLKQNNIEKASELIERSIAIKQQNGDTGGLAFGYYGRGKVNLAKKDFKEAESDFEEANRIHLFMGEMLGMGLGYHKLAKLYIQIGQLQKAKNALTNGIALATQHNIAMVKYKCYFLFYQVFKLENDTVNALHYLELYHQQKETAVKTQPVEVIERQEAIIPTEYKKETRQYIETAENTEKNEVVPQNIKVQQEDLPTVISHEIEQVLPPIVSQEVETALTPNLTHEVETVLTPVVSHEVETPLTPFISNNIETPRQPVVSHEVETPLPPVVSHEVETLLPPVASHEIETPLPPAINSEVEIPLPPVVSHEIETPLPTVVSHDVKTLSSPVITDTRPSIEKADDVKKQLTDRITFLANNLPPINRESPAVTKPDAASATLETQQSDFKKMLENIKNSYDGSATEKGLRLNLNIHYTVGDYYELDETKIRQIIGSLVKNAIKFTDAGQIDINVRKVSGDETADKVRFEIMDTGVGIDKDYLETIFHSSSTGSGLAVVKKLVELHGAKINVDSTAGRGSVFYFDLTLKQTSSPGKPATKQLDSLHGKTVLLAEDNMINAMLARKLLANWKIVTDHAENGRIAVEKSRLKVYDFVLMDIQMPEMDGFEATSHIHNPDNINYKTPVFALTAGIAAEMQEKSRELFNGVLGKPIQIDKLQEALLSST